MFLKSSIKLTQNLPSVYIHRSHSSVIISVYSTSTSLFFPRVQMYSSVEAWLDSLGLARYANIFKDKGIIKLYQVPSITEEV